MKLKTKWEQRYKFYALQQRIACEYMDTPFGRITITLNDIYDRYEQPYKLHIPGSDFIFFSSPSEAKQFTDAYLLREITKLIDMTASAQPPTQPTA